MVICGDSWLEAPLLPAGRGGGQRSVTAPQPRVVWHLLHHLRLGGLWSSEPPLLSVRAIIACPGDGDERREDVPASRGHPASSLTARQRGALRPGCFQQAGPISCLAFANYSAQPRAQRLPDAALARAVGGDDSIMLAANLQQECSRMNGSLPSALIPLLILAAGSCGNEYLPLQQAPSSLRRGLRARRQLFHFQPLRNLNRFLI